MIALLQRVTQSQVSIAGETVGSIGPGLMTLVCAERGDTDADVSALLGRLIRYRVFADAEGRMNRSLLDVQAEARTDSAKRACLLLVPQFTLAADTSTGLRPGFSGGAAPEDARRLFDLFVDRAQEHIAEVQTGRFGADMQVSLTNDGPVTFWLRQPRQPRESSEGQKDG